MKKLNEMSLALYEEGLELMDKEDSDEITRVQYCIEQTHKAAEYINSLLSR